MSQNHYQWNREESTEGNLQRIAMQQTELALDAAQSRGDVPERVHEIRKACKRVRALLRLVRPALGDSYTLENARFRDIGRTISDLRDSQSSLECYDKLMDRFDEQVDRQHFSPIRRYLTMRYQEQEDDQAAERLQQVANQLDTARESIVTWTLDKQGAEAWAGGVARTYKRARKGMKKAEKKPSADNFHDWRKRVKYHRHHAELLRPMFPSLLKGRAKAAHELTDLLGDAHDLDVLKDAVAPSDGAGDPQRLVEMQELMDRYRDELQQESLAQGERLLADKTDDLVDRWKTFWKAWARESQRLAA